VLAFSDALFRAVGTPLDGTQKCVSKGVLRGQDIALVKAASDAAKERVGIIGENKASA
jgi:hypothetical protein